MTKQLDCWCTPDWLFKKLEKEHGPFDIDLCATSENSKCNDFCIDYLNDIAGKLDSNCVGQLGTYHNIKAAFMNPPYSNPLPFIEKAWEDSKHCKIVCLLKVDPSTKWWSVFWNYDNIHCCCDNPLYEFKNAYYCKTCSAEYDYFDLYDPEIKRGPKPGCQVHFLPKRVKFDPPIGYTGKVSSPSFPSCVVVMDRR